LLPKHVDELVKAGFKVTVEECRQRCVPIKEYKNCDIVKAGAWVDAPSDAVIVGLKELPDDNFPLRHTHIFFAHCFKGQSHSKHLLNRFSRGKGRLYDLEYLTEPDGKRVAAFGVSAGMAGAAIGALVWAFRKNNKDAIYPSINTFENYDILISHVKEKLGKNKPKVIIVGSKGRVGTGATRMMQAIGADVDLWDHARTRTNSTGPYLELLGADIFVNCIFLSQTDRFVFLDKETLKMPKPNRKLDTVVDISCDITSANNPLKLYSELTSFQKPSERLSDLGVDVIQIDHLPSLVPLESSQDFTGQLMPHLLKFSSTPVWDGAAKLFDAKVKLYQE
jgi:saccharopine dehydrogenase (NAD+, L-lysine-forming)